VSARVHHDLVDVPVMNASQVAACDIRLRPPPTQPRVLDVRNYGVDWALASTVSSAPLITHIHGMAVLR
jgi:hypothetical protein